MATYMVEVKERGALLHSVQHEAVDGASAIALVEAKYPSVRVFVVVGKDKQTGDPILEPHDWTGLEFYARRLN